MNYLSCKSLSLIFIISFCLSVLPVWTQKISPFLQICYGNNIILHPMTMTTFIDIMRKLELSQNSFYSPRTLASMLIHKFTLDGVERNPSAVVYNDGVIPFRISGFQRYRNEILKRKLLPLELYYYENVLTLAEKCTLHFMLSSSVDLWERGDEFQICPKLTQQKQWYTGEMFGTKMSSCPIEMGVVWWQDQAISPSRIIAALLASLQPINIPMDPWNIRNNNSNLEQLSSIWASTIAGDLGEVVSMQVGTNVPFIGPAGYWNDSVIPTNYFLITDYNNIANRSWQFTDSELLGDTDGLMMASDIIKWESRRNLKLSQMMEMFYKGGVTTTSCFRLQFHTNEIDKRRRLVEQQTKYFAKEIYEICEKCNYQDNEAMDKLVKMSYDKFNDHAKQLLHKPICPMKLNKWPRVQLSILFDSTFLPYTKLKFFMMLADKVDVSHYGSKITLINGETGAVVVNNAHTSGVMYALWINASNYDKDPKYMDISKSVLSLNHLLNKRDNQSSWIETLDPAYSHVTLIIGTQSTLQNSDMDSFRSVQRNLLAQYPEQRIFYLSSPLNYDIFKTLGGFWRDHIKNKAIIVDPNKPEEEIEKIMKLILSVRRELKPNKCQGDQTTITTNYFEVITPHVTYNYIIDSEYLCRSDSTVNIKMMNGANGEVQMCMKRDDENDKHDACVESKLNQVATISLTDPSKNDKHCKPIFLEIRGDRTLFNCADGTCRRPDQIKFTLQIEGLQCISSTFWNCNSAGHKPKLRLIYTMLLLTFLAFTV